MAERDDAGGGTGSARRRRERRLRSFLRHERMSVAMTLAESTHHSTQREKTARAGAEARDALRGHVPEAPLLQGGRPAPLPEVAGWKTRVQRHSVEHLTDLAPLVQILDVPVAMDFFRRLDLPVVEQVTDVPTISSSSRSSRAALREPQMAEQLVDVPIQHIVELLLQHPVDFPVPQVGFAGGGQQGFFSLWTGFGGRADR